MFKWIPPTQAAMAAMEGYPEMEALREGHAILDKTQFCQELLSGNLEILMVSAGFVLVSWSYVKEGKAFQIMTVSCDMKSASVSIEEMEAAARERDTNLIITMARPGWEKLMRAHGYEVTPRILVRKVLSNGHSIPQTAYSH